MTFEELDLNKTYSYADYLLWAFKERLELLRGKVFKMSPAPNSRHQFISGEIFFQLRKFLDSKSCRVFTAPFDVRLPQKNSDGSPKNTFTVVQPDICVICDLKKIDTRGCIGAPDLVVEILSPGNTEREMKDKFAIYEEYGIKEYWLIEPRDKVLLVYILNEEGKYIGLRPFVATDTFKSPTIIGFELSIKELFE